MLPNKNHPLLGTPMTNGTPQLLQTPSAAVIAPAGRRVVLEAFHRFLDQGLLPLQRGLQDLDLRGAQGDLAIPGAW